MKRRVSVIVLCFVLTLGGYSAGFTKIPNPSRKPAYSSVSAPLFVVLDGINATPFQEVIKAVSANDLPLAITKTKTLAQQSPAPVPEVAAFLLGELYLKQAEQGGEEAIPQAMISFQKAIATYPKSKNVPLGYLMIGGIYARQRLFYEAIGSFNRVVKRPIQDRYTLKAKIEIAETYKNWGQWPYAKATYTDILSEALLPLEEKQKALFGYADTLYQMGRFEKAYQLYKEASVLMPSYRFRDPIALFQFGEAAFRSGHVTDAKKLLLGFYNIHPGDPLAPVALVRAKTLFQRTKKPSVSHLATPNLASTDDTFYRTSKKPVVSDGFYLAQILSSVERLKECAPLARSKQVGEGLFLADDSIPCNMPLKTAAFLPSIKRSDADRKKIEAHAMRLLKDHPPSTTALGVLMEAVHQLKQYKEVESIVGIQATSLIKLSPYSPYREEIQDTLKEIITKQLGTVMDPMTIVMLYHTYSPAFTKKMLKEETGFVIAMSHLEVGLFSKAADLFRPVAENYKHPLSDDALYQFGQMTLKLGRDDEAKVALLQYQQRVKRGGYRVSTDLGDIAFRQNKIEEALIYYRHGLRLAQDLPDRKRIYGKLADVYRFQSDFDNEINIYLKWIKEDPDAPNLPYVGLAEAYAQSGQYKKGIESYQIIINDPARGRDTVEWAQLRMAIAYELLGDFKQGDQLYTLLARKARTSLIRQMAKDHLRSIVKPHGESLPSPAPLEMAIVNQYEEDRFE